MQAQITLPSRKQHNKYETGDVVMNDTTTLHE